NHLSNNSLSISDYYTTGSLIIGNVMRPVNTGLEVPQVKGSRIIDNTIIGGNYGLIGHNSIILVHGCSFLDQTMNALNINSFDGSVITNNTITDAENIGMDISYTGNLRIEGNDMHGCGIFLNSGQKQDLTSLRIALNNTVNELPLLALVNETDRDLWDDYGQIILINCTDIDIGYQDLDECTIGVTAMFCSDITIDRVTSGWNTKGVIIHDSARVKISNCTFHNSTWTGIGISYVSGFSIKDTHLNDNNGGLYAERSVNLSVSDLTMLRNSGDGTIIYGSTNLSVEDCIISGSENYGIYLGGCKGETKVRGNTISDITSMGIYLNGHGARILDNDISQCYYGIALYYSQGTQVSGNHLTGCGIVIEGGGSVDNWIMNEIDATNQVNGKPVSFVKNASGTPPLAGSGQILIANSSYLQVWRHDLDNCSIGVQVGHCNSIAIHENEIDVFQGIDIVHSTDIIVLKNRISSDGAGVQIYYCSGTVINENTIRGGGGGAITSTHSFYSTIEDNELTNGSHGIGGYFYNAEISGNRVHDIDSGIRISGGYSNITNNRCEDVNSTSILISGGTHRIEDNFCERSGIGIYSSGVSDTIIRNNSCIENDYGIYMTGSYYGGEEVLIEGNTVSDNEVGMKLYGKSLYRVMDNDISDNSQSGISLKNNDGSVLYENRLVGNGLWFEGEMDQWNCHEIPGNNSVNGLPIKYIADEVDRTIDGQYGQIIIAGCDIIKINGTYLSDSTAGILIAYSTGILITGSSFTELRQYGLYSLLSFDIDLVGCDIIGNGVGISLYKSERINISDSQILHNTLSGFHSNRSSLISIFNDTVENNGMGVRLDHSDEVLVTFSNLTGNTIALNLSKTFASRVAYCNIEENELGIRIDSGSQNNNFHHNDFVSNIDGNAIDSGSKNTFDDKVGEGNYWDDYRTRYPNARSNGRIWDIPYSVLDENDTLRALDRYPLVDRVFFEDDDAPEVIDLSPGTAFTGEIFIFRAGLSDPSGIMKAEVEYGFGGEGPITASSMNRTSDDNWSLAVRIPESLAPMRYRFTVSDNLFNTISTQWVDVPVVDDEPPAVPEDHSDTGATTGETFWFRAVSSDNIELGSITVEYWFGAGPHMTDHIWDVDGDGLPIIVPSNSTDPLHYVLTATDSSLNEASANEKEIQVVDNDPPYAEAGHDRTVNAGDMVYLDGEGSSDNVGIASYEWRFPYLGGSVVLRESKTAFRFGEEGSYVVTLRVRDAFGNEDTDELRITVLEEPAENPVYVNIGPVMDIGGSVLKNVEVVLKFVSATERELTNREGNATFWLLPRFLGEQANITLSKEGYSTVHFDAVIRSDGSLDREIPRMTPLRPDDGPKDTSYAFLWVIAAIALLALTAAGIYLYTRYRYGHSVDIWEE
ncbi:MAG: NosD domain-containing protein, partial [Thermoplasmatota archaeon]